MDLEDLCTDLKVIAMLKENGRLCIRNGHLSIEPSLKNKENVMYTWGSYASLALRRWWNQDNRHSALLKVQSIIMKCHNVVSKLENNTDFTQLCKDAANGLTQLQTTYRDDAATSARIGVYIKNLNNI